MIAVAHPNVMAADEQVLIFVARFMTDKITSVLHPVHSDKMAVAIDRDFVITFVEEMNNGIHLNVESDHLRSFPKPFRA